MQQPSRNSIDRTIRKRADREQREPKVRSTDRLQELLWQLKKKDPDLLEELLYTLFSKSCMPPLDIAISDHEVIKMVWAKQGITLLYEEVVKLIGEKQDGEKVKR